MCVLIYLYNSKRILFVTNSNSLFLLLAMVAIGEGPRKKDVCLYACPSIKGVAWVKR